MIDQEKEYFVYILRCKDSSLYTGYAANLEDRIKKHNEGLGAKYTRARRPVKLLVAWKIKGRSPAMRLEAFLKKLKKSEKETIVKKPDIINSNDIFKDYTLRLLYPSSSPTRGDQKK